MTFQSPAGTGHLSTYLSNGLLLSSVLFKILVSADLSSQELTVSRQTAGEPAWYPTRHPVCG